MQRTRTSGKKHRINGFDCLVILGGLINLLLAIYLVAYWLQY